MKNVLVFIIVLLFSQVGISKTLKVAVLAPAETNWANSIERLAKRIELETNGRVKFKVYFGGVAGDEPDVLRKVRINQFQGGIFTGKTLGELFGDTRVIEVPFTYGGDQRKAKKNLDEMSEYFSEGLSKAGFASLGYFEVGPVYLVSKKKIQGFEDLKGTKIWVWQGDPVAVSLLKTLNLTGVPLALPDVHSSLSTGIIEAAYAPPIGILALQWHTKTRYIVDFPVAYSIGAFLLKKTVWNQISTEDQMLMQKISSEEIEKANLRTVAENKEALEAFETLGLEKVRFSENDIKKTKSLRDSIIRELTGKVFSKLAVRTLEKVKSVK